MRMHNTGSYESYEKESPQLTDEQKPDKSYTPDVQTNEDKTIFTTPQVTFLKRRYLRNAKWWHFWTN